MSEHRLSLSALAKSLQDGAHSIFSASGSPLWTGCSGGLIPNLLEKDDASIYAAEGSVGHGVGEQWLRSGVKPMMRVGDIDTIIEPNGEKFEIEITEEMLDHVKRYVDWCKFLPGQHFIETRVDFSHITPIPKQGGTADHAACTYQCLVITDLKYGMGERVIAEKNTQGLLYAIGFFEAWDWLYDFQRIVIRIAQPRLLHFDEWEITREELLEWADWLRERATAAWKIDAPRTASPKACRWCLVKNTCAAHAVMQARLTEGAWGDASEPVTVDDALALKARLAKGEFADFFDPYTLNNEHLGQLLQYKKQSVQFWEEIEKLARERAFARQAVYGHKLVQGRSQRRWNQPGTIASKLIALGCKPEHVFDESVISPHQSEAALRKAGFRPAQIEKVLEDLASSWPGQPVLAPLHDGRREWVDLTQDAWGDESGADANQSNHETGEL